MIERTATIKLRGEGDEWHASVLASGDRWADIDCKGQTQGETAERALRYALVHLADPPSPLDRLFHDALARPFAE